MNRRGFTLIEVLASIVIIGVAIIPLARIINQSFAISLKEERLNRVIFLAERKAEEVIGKVIHTFATSRDDANAFASPYNEYRFTVVDDEASDLKAITVTVWHDENGDGTKDSDEESIILYTQVADR